MRKQVSEEVTKLEPEAVRYRTAAGMLECSESTVRKLVRLGQLQAVKVGNDERVTVKSIRSLAAA